jgi:CRISPR system Cascade subunit CasA
VVISFNLMEEAFVPVVRVDGRCEELGLRAVLREAHKIRELRDDSPLVTAALHRLLLAILHRVFGPENADAWAQLRDRGQWEGEALDAYLDSDRCRHRFDLFDGQRPFYQTAGFRTDPPGGIGRLAHEVACGNNATLFDHSRDDPPATVSPAEAARLLIAQQAYAIGGGKSATGYTAHAPLLQGVVILPQGATLFETLLLNLQAYNRSSPVEWREQDDPPVWERDDPGTRASPQPRGYLDYLTWQSRTVALHPETVDGRTVVRQVSYAQGRKLDAPGLFDPQMAYRRSKEQGWRALRLNEDRALWRDSTALFRAAGDDDHRPACLEWLYQLEGHGVSPGQCYDLAAIGLCTDKAKVHFWRHERMPLPVRYLHDIDLVKNLEVALSEADQVEYVLRDGVRRFAADALAPTGGNPDRDRVGAFVDSLAPERLYWSRLEVPFLAFFRQLAEQAGDPERQWAAVCRWAREDLRKQAVAAFEQTAGRLDQSPRLLRAGARAGRDFRGRLAARINRYEEETDEQTA